MLLLLGIDSQFSLPGLSSPQSCQRISCHSTVATPLLVVFELLLCVYLEGINDHGESFIDLKLVFLPLLALEIITLVDNFRMCGTLMPGHGETMTDEAIWERLPHFWVAISMVFLLAATSLMLLKLCSDAVTLGWWDLSINFGISQCFAFLVCTRWSNPMDIGGPILIIPIVIFQVLLCTRLEVLHLMHDLSQFEPFSYPYFCCKWLLYVLLFGDSSKGLLLNCKVHYLVVY